MKVVYEKTILEQLREARQKAERERKTISHVELSETEMRRLVDEMGPCYFGTDLGGGNSFSVTLYCGRDGAPVTYPVKALGLTLKLV